MYWLACWSVEYVICISGSEPLVKIAIFDIIHVLICLALQTVTIWAAVHGIERTLSPS